MNRGQGLMRCVLGLVKERGEDCDHACHKGADESVV